MEKYIYEGKTLEEALNLALYELNLNEDQITYEYKEEKKGLFKPKQYIVTITKKADYIEMIKNLLKEIFTIMGIDLNFEVIKSPDYIYINIFTNEDNKAILIGKNGKNLLALNQIVKQFLIKHKVNLKVNIDLAGYKKDREKKIAALAKKLAKEVLKSKIEVTMDPMNSYERRIVHNTLSNNKYIMTESIGEEPERKVVIKLKEE